MYPTNSLTISQSIIKQYKNSQNRKDNKYTSQLSKLSIEIISAPSRIFSVSKMNLRLLSRVGLQLENKPITNLGTGQLQYLSFSQRHIK